ncbi:hypothetical protein [Streptomyces javensis]|uniref:Uncharacterized protein n=1 Tax=Streptomyces javensis TaxID=114698 RepID=A0ABS0RH82_9ACTN|nr:hypothetical protein [Streptomyces javensis]MBI0316797.1 hypothetical protein [Streptomyces javensis]
METDYGALLRKSLQEFREGRISLARFVSDVDSIWESLEPSEAKDRIRGDWWTLEQVLAVDVIDRGLDTLPPDAEQLVAEALEGLESASRSLDSGSER